jgi:hypothetical protein
MNASMRLSTVLPTFQSLPKKTTLRAFVDKFNHGQKRILLSFFADIVTSLCQEYWSLPDPDFVTRKNKKFLFHLVMWFCHTDTINVEQWLCVGEKLCPPQHWAIKDHAPKGEKQGLAIPSFDQSIVMFFRGLLLVQHSQFIFMVQRKDDKIGLFPHDSIKENFSKTLFLSEHTMCKLLESLEGLEAKEIKNHLNAMEEQEYSNDKLQLRSKLNDIRVTCDQLDHVYPNITTVASSRLVSLARSFDKSINEMERWRLQRNRSFKRKRIHVYRPEMISSTKA